MDQAKTGIREKSRLMKPVDTQFCFPNQLIQGKITQPRKKDLETIKYLTNAII